MSVYFAAKPSHMITGCGDTTPNHNKMITYICNHLQQLLEANIVSVSFVLDPISRHSSVAISNLS